MSLRTCTSLSVLDTRAKEQEVAMPWFPDFVGAMELGRRQTRAAGLADPMGSTSRVHRA